MRLDFNRLFDKIGFDDQVAAGDCLAGEAIIVRISQPRWNVVISIVDLTFEQGYLAGAAVSTAATIGQADILTECCIQYGFPLLNGKQLSQGLDFDLIITHRLAYLIRNCEIVPHFIDY